MTGTVITEPLLKPRYSRAGHLARTGREDIAFHGDIQRNCLLTVRTGTPICPLSFCLKRPSSNAADFNLAVLRLAKRSNVLRARHVSKITSMSGWLLWG